MSPKVGDRICDALAWAISLSLWLTIAAGVGALRHLMPTAAFYWAGGTAIALLILRWPIERTLPGEEDEEADCP